MYEYTPRYCGDLRKLFIPDSSPRTWESFAAFEAMGRDRNCLDTPIGGCLIRVKDVDRLLSVGNGELLLELKKMFLAK